MTALADDMEARKKPAPRHYADSRQARFETDCARAEQIPSAGPIVEWARVEAAKWGHIADACERVLRLAERAS